VEATNHRYRLRFALRTSKLLKHISRQKYVNGKADKT